MPKENLIRLGGLAAILAGILRGVGSVVPDTSPDVALQILYFFTDLFIILGIITLYGIWHKETGKLGFLGFLIAIVGVEIIRSNRVITGVNLYPAGALIFSVGLNVLGFSLWRAKILPGWVLCLWILSILAGFIVHFIPWLNLLFVIAGLMFAIGFVGAGIKLWSAADNTKDAGLQSRIV